MSCNTPSLAKIRAIRQAMSHLAAALRAWEIHITPLPASPRRIKIRRPEQASEQVPEQVPEQAPEQAPEPSFNCTMCTSTHKTKDLLAYHIAAKHTNKCFKCPRCDYSSPRLSNVYQHATSKHCKGIIATFKQTGGTCLFCNKKCNSNPSYKQHCFTCPSAVTTLNPEELKFREQVMNLTC